MNFKVFTTQRLVEKVYDVFFCFGFTFIFRFGWFTR